MLACMYGMAITSTPYVCGSSSARLFASTIRVEDRGEGLQVPPPLTRRTCPQACLLHTRHAWEAKHRSGVDEQSEEVFHDALRALARDFGDASSIVTFDYLRSLGCRRFVPQTGAATGSLVHRRVPPPRGDSQGPAVLCRVAIAYHRPKTGVGLRPL